MVQVSIIHNYQVPYLMPMLLPITSTFHITSNQTYGIDLQPNTLQLNSLLLVLPNDTNTFLAITSPINWHNSSEFLNQFNTSSILQPSSIILSRP